MAGLRSRRVVPGAFAEIEVHAQPGRCRWANPMLRGVVRGRSLSSEGIRSSCRRIWGGGSTSVVTVISGLRLRCRRDRQICRPLASDQLRGRNLELGRQWSRAMRVRRLTSRGSGRSIAQKRARSPRKEFLSEGLSPLAAARRPRLRAPGQGGQPTNSKGTGLCWLWNRSREGRGTHPPRHRHASGSPSRRMQRHSMRGKWNGPLYRLPLAGWLTVPSRCRYPYHSP